MAFVDKTNWGNGKYGLTVGQRNFTFSEYPGGLNKNGHQTLRKKLSICGSFKTKKNTLMKIFRVSM